MSDLTNDIVLRPRFKIDLTVDLESLMKNFDRDSEPPFVMKRLDEHIYLRFKKEHKKGPQGGVGAKYTMNCAFILFYVPAFWHRYSFCNPWNLCLLQTFSWR